MGGPILEVTVVGCSDLDSGHNIFDKMDTFVTLRYADQQFQTKIAKGGGKNPKFDEKFTVSVRGPPHVLEVVIQDRDHFSKNDFVGRAQVSFGEAVEKGEGTVDQPLKNDKGQEEGRIQLLLKVVKPE